MIPNQMSLQFSGLTVDTAGTIFVKQAPAISKQDFNASVFSAAQTRGERKPILQKTYSLKQKCKEITLNLPLRFCFS